MKRSATPLLSGACRGEFSSPMPFIIQNSVILDEKFSPAPSNRMLMSLFPMRFSERSLQYLSDMKRSLIGLMN